MSPVVAVEWIDRANELRGLQTTWHLACHVRGTRARHADMPFKDRRNSMKRYEGTEAFQVGHI